MNAQRTIDQILRERNMTKQQLSEKLGYKHSSNLTEKLRNPNGIRSDILIEILNQLDCELVVVSKTKDKRKWVLDSINEE